MSNPQFSTTTTHGRSHSVHSKAVLGSYGWGVGTLSLTPVLKVLDYQHHKQHWDADKINSFIRGNGGFPKVRDRQTDTSLA